MSLQKKKDIIYQDIKKEFSFSQHELIDYKFMQANDKLMLYAPIIIRPEGQSVIYSWNYLFNDKLNILSRSTHIFDEGMLNENIRSVVVNLSPYASENVQAEKIIVNNSNMFPEKNFEISFMSIQEKFSIEVILQQANFRFRFRNLADERLVYDLYYDEKSKKLSYNLFSPII